jgi:hypothetical protein
MRYLIVLALVVCGARSFAADLNLPKPYLPPELSQKEKMAQELDNKALWYRDASEWMMARTIYSGLATDPNTRIATNGKRWDMEVGKRIPLFTWDNESPHDAWSIGIDGGILASLTRIKGTTTSVFATETFDGFFGINLGRAFDGHIIMLRTGHLSAHLVDNSPRINILPVTYSQFWTEFIFGENFVHPSEMSRWDVYSQFSVGANYVARPKPRGPRLAFGTTIAYHFSSPDSLAFIVSGNVLKAGVESQKAHYNLFAGIGNTNHALATKRPFRIGVSHYAGSDHRNQLYFEKERFTAVEAQIEF